MSYGKAVDMGLAAFCQLSEAKDLLTDALEIMHDHQLPGRGRAANAVSETAEAIEALERLLRQAGALE